MLSIPPLAHLSLIACVLLTRLMTIDEVMEDESQNDGWGRYCAFGSGGSAVGMETFRFKTGATAAFA